MASKEQTLSNLILSGYLKSKPVILAMRKLSRELFLPASQRPFAWEDRPLPIGFGQTISAPHMYAFMLEAAQIKPGMRILEIGAGSGYGAALLSLLAGKKGEVISLEIVPELAAFAQDNLKKAGCKAQVVCCDGYEGYPQKAPFDRILVTAACEHMPPALPSQLKLGGKMLIPVGKFFQELLLVEKTQQGIFQKPILPVLFVPLTGKIKG
ncbi:MAG: protein-L-isoaspartate(D-aspartate) O-methyltransferase [Candidatus Micrarchaeota archaeon]|nr:protein-L-isoaspartate(D-aspartate) O-methyltransferase [Candidatus Micrarchaeota archaeon]